MGSLLELQSLGVAFEDAAGRILPAVQDVSFGLGEACVTCLVGESGCGKSLTAKACMRLLPSQARVAGAVRFQGEDLLALPERRMRSLRGRELAMIFQEPMTALNPVLTVGFQAAEPLRTHLRLSRREAMERVVELFRQVNIPSPEARFGVYPHELSGGMRQRVMIAMALACGPRALLADEPTTALDPTIQGQILSILLEQREKRGMSVLLITHDLGVVAQTADMVGVMYAGRLVEFGTVKEVLLSPRHPYTQGLLASAPSRKAMLLGRLPAIPGTVPPLGQIPRGCPFHPRCHLATKQCLEALPPEREDAGHRTLCWLA